MTQPQRPTAEDMAVDLQTCYEDWLSGEPTVDETGQRIHAAVVAIGAAFRRAIHGEHELDRLKCCPTDSDLNIPIGSYLEWAERCYSEVCVAAIRRALDAEERLGRIAVDIDSLRQSLIAGTLGEAEFLEALNDLHAIATRKGE